MKNSKLVIKSYKSCKIVDLNDILYCKGDGRYTWIHLKNESPILSAKVLKNFENMLSDTGFLRTHKSCLINLCYIKSFNAGKKGNITMDNGENLPLAKRRKKEFINRVNQIYQSL